MRIALDRRPNKARPVAQAVRGAFSDHPIPTRVDPAFARYSERHRMGGGFFVFLNGKIVPGITIAMADEEEGVVECIELTEAGQLVMDGNRPKRVTRRGKVKITEYIPNGELVTPLPRAATSGENVAGAIYTTD